MSVIFKNDNTFSWDEGETWHPVNTPIELPQPEGLVGVLFSGDSRREVTGLALTWSSAQWSGDTHWLVTLPLPEMPKKPIPHQPTLFELDEQNCKKLFDSVVGTEDRDEPEFRRGFFSGLEYERDTYETSSGTSPSLFDTHEMFKLFKEIPETINGLLEAQNNADFVRTTSTRDTIADADEVLYEAQGNAESLARAASRLIKRTDGSDEKNTQT